MRFGIIAAIEPEARVFQRPTGRLLGIDEYIVAVAGPGRENAARMANQMVNDGCEVLISWGVAGALSGDYRAGDLILSAQAMTGTGEMLSFDEQLRARFAAALGENPMPRPGTVVTVATAAATARDKALLRKRFGADAVDMESTAIAYVARSAAKGYLCIRAIVDNADFNIPSAAFKGLDGNGKLRPLRTVAEALENPTQIPQLIRLARDFRRSVKTLQRAARRLVS